jgi:hypothetical protein
MNMQRLIAGPTYLSDGTADLYLTYIRLSPRKVESVKSQGFVSISPYGNRNHDCYTSSSRFLGHM